MRRLLFLLAACGAVAAGVPATVGAATLTVNSTVDVADSNTGDGVCSGGAPAGNACTLRAAVEQAAQLPGPDTITLPAGTYQLAVGLGQLNVTTSAVTINGAGARTTIIRAGSGSRVMTASAGLTLRDLTLTGGSVNSGTLHYGGGLRITAGDALLDRVAITGNTISSDTAAYGGGVGVEGGTLTIQNSAITGNTATANSASSGSGGGGGVYVSAPVTIRRSTIAGNITRNYAGATFSSGGGVSVSNSATIEQSTIAGNSAEGGAGFQQGGGMYVNVTPPQVLRIGGTILSGNNASDSGANCWLSSGTISQTAKNLISNVDCLGTEFGTIRGVNPQLGALADNGGPTNTMLPALGSPALDAATSCGTDTADQRGNTPLPAGAACDLGAVELGADRSVTLQSSKTSAAAGQDVVLTATITNTAVGDPATGEGLTIELPAGASASSAVSTQGSCTSGTTVTCALGTLHRGAGATVTAVITATGADMTITARRTGSLPDPAAANDAASLTVGGVTPPSDGSLPGGLPPGNGVPGVLPTLADTIAPTVSGLKLGKKPTLKRGATLRFSLSEPATVTVTTERAKAGRKQGSRCVAGRKTGKRCTAHTKLKTKTFTLAAGPASIKLTKRQLAAAKLRFSLVATDAAGNTSAVVRKSGTVKRR